MQMEAEATMQSQFFPFRVCLQTTNEDVMENQMSNKRNNLQKAKNDGFYRRNTTRHFNKINKMNALQSNVWIHSQSCSGSSLGYQAYDHEKELEAEKKSNYKHEFNSKEFFENINLDKNHDEEEEKRKEKENEPQETDEYRFSDVIWIRKDIQCEQNINDKNVDQKDHTLQKLENQKNSEYFNRSIGYQFENGNVKSDINNYPLKCPSDDDAFFVALCRSLIDDHEERSEEGMSSTRSSADYDTSPMLDSILTYRSDSPRLANLNNRHEEKSFDSRRIRIHEMLESLLRRIYGDSSDSQSPPKTKACPEHIYTYTLAELRPLVAELRFHVQFAGSLLVQYLRRRDALRRRYARHCDVITAHLHALSAKRSEDTKMRFSPEPQPGDSGFSQWLSAMKMVAQLPGGIPPEFRRTLWLTLAERHLAARNIDWERAERVCFNEWTNPDDDELGVQIVKDLHRTGCSLFCGAQGEHNQAVLKRVLLGYARWNKSVGYCQGFNMLAALVLQVLDTNHSHALKVMIYLVEGVLPEGYFANNLSGLSVDMAVLRELLRLRLPTLHKHLQYLHQLATSAGGDAASASNYEPPLINVFTMQWFLTLFCNCLPQQTVLRVWDMIFLEGNEILLKTALAIWDCLADRILSVDSADEFYSIMGVLTREMMELGTIDTNTLVKKIVCVGSLPVSELRDKYRYSISPVVPWHQLRLLPDSRDPDAKALFPSLTAFPASLPRPDALDISALKHQYAKLRERQRHAHIILSAACARQPLGPSAPSPAAMNHLLIGKQALLSTRRARRATVVGIIPPPRKTTITKTKESEGPKESRGETLQWKDVPAGMTSSSDDDDDEKIEKEDNNNGECKKDDKDTNIAIKVSRRKNRRSNSNSSSSSTSTELCDGFDYASDTDEISSSQPQQEEEKYSKRPAAAPSPVTEEIDPVPAQDKTKLTTDNENHSSDSSPIEALLDLGLDLKKLISPTIEEEKLIITTIDASPTDEFANKEETLNLRETKSLECVTIENNKEVDKVANEDEDTKNYGQYRSEGGFDYLESLLESIKSQRKLGIETNETITIEENTIDQEKDLENEESKTAIKNEMTLNRECSTSRRNSARALQIIQENSEILQRILQCQKKISDEDGDENHIRAPTFFSKSEELPIINSDELNIPKTRSQNASPSFTQTGFKFDFENKKKCSASNEDLINLTTTSDLLVSEFKIEINTSLPNSESQTDTNYDKDYPKTYSWKYDEHKEEIKNDFLIDTTINDNGESKEAISSPMPFLKTLEYQLKDEDSEKMTINKIKGLNDDDVDGDHDFLIGTKVIDNGENKETIIISSPHPFLKTFEYQIKNEDNKILSLGGFNEDKKIKKEEESKDVINSPLPFLKKLEYQFKDEDNEILTMDDNNEVDYLKNRILGKLYSEKEIDEEEEENNSKLSSSFVKYKLHSDTTNLKFNLDTDNEGSPSSSSLSSTTLSYYRSWNRDKDELKKSSPDELLRRSTTFDSKTNYDDEEISSSAADARNSRRQSSLDSRLASDKLEYSRSREISELSPKNYTLDYTSASCSTSSLNVELRKGTVDSGVEVDEDQLSDTTEKRMKFKNSLSSFSKNISHDIDDSVIESKDLPLTKLREQEEEDQEIRSISSITLTSPNTSSPIMQFSPKKDISVNFPPLKTSPSRSTGNHFDPFPRKSLLCQPKETTLKLGLYTDKTDKTNK